GSVRAAQSGVAAGGFAQSAGVLRADETGAAVRGAADEPVDRERLLAARRSRASSAGRLAARAEPILLLGRGSPAQRHIPLRKSPKPSHHLPVLLGKHHTLLKHTAHFRR